MPTPSFCTTAHQSLRHYRTELENLETLLHHLGKSPEANVHRSLNQIEVALNQYYRRFADAHTYHHNHKQAVATRGKKFTPQEYPERDISHLPVLTSFDKDNTQRFYTIHDEELTGYSEILGNLWTGPQFATTRAGSLKILSPEGGVSEMYGDAKPQSNFANGVAVVLDQATRKRFLVDETGSCISAEYADLTPYPGGWIEAKRGFRDYQILNARGEVVHTCRDVLKINWGVAMVDDGGNGLHALDLDTGNILQK